MTGSQRSEKGASSKGRRYTGPVLLAATALLGVSMIHNGLNASSLPPRPDPADAPSAAPSAMGAVSPSQPPPMAYSAPKQVRIPALKVDAPVMAVGADSHGGVAAPPSQYKNLAGWFNRTPSPGEDGTAVIDGHVDNMHGPAVFYGLGTLHKGNTIEVSRADGRTAVFTIYGVELFAKNNFPGKRVYGSTAGHPELRVITCGGGFTKAAGYDGNVVIFARLSGEHRTPSATPAPGKSR